jgi:hypothetical protein
MLLAAVFIHVRCNVSAFGQFFLQIFKYSVTACGQNRAGRNRGGRRVAEYRLSHIMTHLKANPNKKNTSLSHCNYCSSILSTNYALLHRTVTPINRLLDAAKWRYVSCGNENSWYGEGFFSPRGQGDFESIVASRNPLTSGFYIGAEDSIPLGCDAVSLEELSTFHNACFFRVKESIPEDMLLV